jgi:tRNA pseudouridine55 synthase
MTSTHPVFVSSSGTVDPVARVRQVRRALTGVLLLDKPVGLSSTTALGRARWLYQAEKAGHTGTLDPFATGLLPLCFGEATKFSRFMLDAEKSYTATLKLGSRTLSGDTETAPFETRPVNATAEQVQITLKKFLGAQTQVPPMHSALKQDGVPLYKLARQGLEVERASRHINVVSLAMVSLNVDVLVIECRVSKGTYIRVLAEDIGEALGCGAHLTGLRRTSTGGFMIADAVTLDQLENMSLAERDKRLQICESLCAALPLIALNAAPSIEFGHGRVVQIGTAAAGEFRVRAHDGRFLGIGAVDGARPSELKPVRLMA